MKNSIFKIFILLHVLGLGNAIPGISQVNPKFEDQRFQKLQKFKKPRR
jgi:hypothetical protein